MTSFAGGHGGTAPTRTNLVGNEKRQNKENPLQSLDAERRITMYPKHDFYVRNVPNVVFFCTFGTFLT